MRYLREEIYAQRKTASAPAQTHQLKAVYVSDMQQEIHQKESP